MIWNKILNFNFFTFFFVFSKEDRIDIIKRQKCKGIIKCPEPLRPTCQPGLGQGQDSTAKKLIN